MQYQRRDQDLQDLVDRHAGLARGAVERGTAQRWASQGWVSPTAPAENVWGLTPLGRATLVAAQMVRDRDSAGSAIWLQ